MEEIRGPVQRIDDKHGLARGRRRWGRFFPDDLGAGDHAVQHSAYSRFGSRIHLADEVRCLLLAHVETGAIGLAERI
jgi:hypothetical protein